MICVYCNKIFNKNVLCVYLATEITLLACMLVSVTFIAKTSRLFSTKSAFSLLSVQCDCTLVFIIIQMVIIDSAAESSSFVWYRLHKSCFGSLFPFKCWLWTKVYLKSSNFGPQQRAQMQLIDQYRHKKSVALIFMRMNRLPFFYLCTLKAIRSCDFFKLFKPMPPIQGLHKTFFSWLLKPRKPKCWLQCKSRLSHTTDVMKSVWDALNSIPSANDC